MKDAEVLVISPFRRPTFRHAISASHPAQEPWDSPAFSIAACVERAGVSVDVLMLQTIYPGYDEDSDADELTGVLKEFEPRLVLFVSDQFIASRSTATLYGMQIVTKILTGSGAVTPPVIGICGRLPTVLPSEVFDVLPELDFAVCGEAEAVVAEAVATLARDWVVDRLGEHPSIALSPRRRSAGDRTSPEPAFVTDVATLPTPAFHLAGSSFELASRRTSTQLSVPFSIRTSYGCKFRCRFCAGVPHWRDYRMKSRSRIAAEVDHLYASTASVGRLAFLEDEIATRDVEHTRDIADVLSARHIVLDGLYTHSSMLSAEVARMLAPIVDRVFLGMDNASDDLLRSMGKGQRLESVLRAVGIAREAGLATHLEWIIGSPEEDVDSIITSMSSIFTLLATGVVASINTYVYCPHPGTEYAVNAAHFGMDVLEPHAMSESGGYPAARTRYLTRNQIFAAYLMSQLIIVEASQLQARALSAEEVRAPGRSELRRLFEQIRGSR
ncbi:MAG: B12-binding domain-containing radical SAM protein [Jatrophihabitans sp.]